MLVYRATLDGPRQILGVAVRPLWAGGAALGPSSTGAPYGVALRFVDAGGRVRTHRGRLVAALAPGTSLRVAGWQVDDGGALVSLRADPPLRRGAAARGGALSDRFRLPFRATAWGVTAVSGADLILSAVCRPAGVGALLLRGVLRLTVETPAAAFRFRIPFCRVVAATVPAGCRWTALAGVTGLHMQVAPGGQITGEAVVAVRCEGRPVPEEARPAGADLGTVRELTAQLEQAAAEPATPGHAVVRGTVQLDLYYTDRAGASRWAGRRLPFSALAELPGAGPNDRLEVTGAVQRLTHRPEDGLTVHLVLALAVTALQARLVTLDGAPCRVEAVVATASCTVMLAEPFWPVPAEPGAAPGVEVRRARLPLAGPPVGWEEAAAVAATPRAAAQPGQGRWEVRAQVGGTPLGEAPYPAPLRAATGGTVALDPGHGLAVVPCMTRVDTGGITLATALARGPVLPPVPLTEGESAESVSLALPGEPRRVWSVAVAHGALRAIVGVAGVGLVAVSAPLSVDLNVVALTAFPVEAADGWQLRVDLAVRRVNG